MFNFLRNLYTVSYSGCTILQPHQQGTRVPRYLHPCQHLLFSVFLIAAIPMFVRWYLMMVLVYIFSFLNIGLFMCLLAICIFFAGMCIQILCSFLIRLCQWRLCGNEVLLEHPLARSFTYCLYLFSIL